MRNSRVLFGICCVVVLLAGAAPRASSGEGAPAAYPPRGSVGADAGGDADAFGKFELRAGVLLHDRGIGDSKKEGGTDVDLEILFPALRGGFFRAIWSPRPHAGVGVNLQGATSRLYGGLTWRLWRPGRFFADGSLGLALHDGELHAGRPDREALGTRVLFREAIELGYSFRTRDGISLLVEHVSNAELARENDGLTDVGIRYVHRF